MIETTNEILTRGIKLTNSDMDRLQITKVYNIRGKVGMTDAELEDITEDVKSVYRQEEIKIYCVREVKETFDNSIISIIMFRDWLFMELYMLNDYNTFKSGLVRLMN